MADIESDLAWLAWCGEVSIHAVKVPAHLGNLEGKQNDSNESDITIWVYVFCEYLVFFVIFVYHGGGVLGASTDG